MKKVIDELVNSEYEVKLKGRGCYSGDFLISYIFLVYIILSNEF